jgi:ABC-type dipeptide/oligopeptide/nickel transport system ATPase component
MKLKKVKISGYKSIKEEITLHIEDRVTILIGANDSGKSNILSALRSLNDDAPFTEAEQNWDLAEGDQAFIEWSFVLSSAERSEVALGIQNQMLVLNKKVKVRDLPSEGMLEITERPWEQGLVEMVAALGKDTQLESVITKNFFSGEVVMRRLVGGILEVKLVDRIAEDAVLSQIEQDLRAKRPRVELFTTS